MEGQRPERWELEQQARERRRAIRKRRRRNQIIRRGMVAAFGVCILGFGVKGIAAGKQTQAKAYGQEPSYKAAAGDSRFDQVLARIGEKPTGQKEAGRPCIVLDAGHGGKDPGTLWNDVYEKDINLAITQKLADILTKAGYEVVMTRDKDERVVLSERVKTAEEHKADLFVSIHQNALEKDTVTKGIQVYCCQDSNEKGGDLADFIHSSLIGATGASDKGVTKDSDFYVLANTTMPACLVETGFLTSTDERERLLDDGYRQKVAQGIAEGIMKFLQEQ